MSDSADLSMARWRLVLGRFADNAMPNCLNGQGSRMDAALDYLYGREYRGRGMRAGGGPGDNRPSSDRMGGSGASQISIPDWLNEVRELFPRETVEIIEHHALDRYGMADLVTDPQVLERLEPSYDLLRTLLTFKSMMHGEVLQMARRIIRQVVEDLKRRLEADVRRVLYGKLNRFQHSPLRVAQNFDWRRTVRANLKHYDPEENRLLIQNPFFFSRVERHLPWHVVLCVDQSGSMTDSVIHSAVMAGILAGLPALKVSLVVFDTAVVDLSGYVDDPAEALMSVQLGGGTDIAKALTYCETLVENPHRTVVVVVTDFYEGGSPQQLVATVKHLCETGAKVMGLAALDSSATPSYDRQMAERLAAAGADIAALTPLQLAEWLMKVIRK
ncbi:MAG TPA: VWA domain-containing protein [Ktedonobacterales bacterium]|nr:VWA domain-containing protein [Ktedonobacterales bacterium]